MKNITSNEKGSGTAFCMLLAIALIYTLETYWTLIEEQVPYPFDLALLLFSSFFIMLCIIMGVSKILSGEKSISQLKRTIKKEKVKLIEIITATREVIKKFDREIKYSSGVMSPKGFKELQTIKGLVCSLESRLALVDELLDTKIDENVYRAYNAMFEDVSVISDPISGLITSDDETEFSYDHIKKEFQYRLSTINHLLPSTQKKRNRVATA